MRPALSRHIVLIFAPQIFESLLSSQAFALAIFSFGDAFPPALLATNSLSFILS